MTINIGSPSVPATDAQIDQILTGLQSLSRTQVKDVQQDPTITRPSTGNIRTFKITTKNGRLLRGGEEFRTLGVNCPDMFSDFMMAGTITGITKANPGVISISAGLPYTFAVGDPIYVSNVGGMVELTTGWYLINSVVSATQYSLKTLAGSPINTTAYTTWTSGGTMQRGHFKNDLITLAGYGVKLIKVSLGPTDSGATNWTRDIGSNGAAPNALLLPSLRIFLDECLKNNIGVSLRFFWNHITIPSVVGLTETSYQTANWTASATRTYMLAFSDFIVKNFYKHPAVATWVIGTEWFNYASIAQFATATTNTGVDHLLALRTVTNDIVATIRKRDFDRSIISAGGAGGSYEAGSPADFIYKMIYTAGDCDIIDYHMYPDRDRASFHQAFVGQDLGGADILIPMMRNACLSVNKVLWVGECAADDDATSYGSPYVGYLSLISYNKAFNAGVEVVLDWAWYVTIGSGIASDLKTVRISAMSQLQTYNSNLVPGYTPPARPYPAPGTYNLPIGCIRGSGTSTGYGIIPNSADISLATPTTSRMVWGFWMRRMSVFDPNNRILGCDNGVNGWLVTMQANEGIRFYLLLNGSYVSFDVSNFNYPDSQSTDATFAYVGDWVHIFVYWDGTPNDALQADGKQHVTIFINGLTVARMPYENKFASGLTDRTLGILANSDGSGSWSNADMFDLMIGKDFPFTAQMAADYVRNGTVPYGMQHRWKLSSNFQDSLGTLHAANTGGGLTFVPNSLGTLVG